MDENNTLWYQERIMEYFSNSVLDAVRRAAAHAGSMRKLAELLNMNHNTISRWLAGTRSPTVLEVSKVMEYVGAKIVLPNDVIITSSPSNVEHKQCSRCKELEEEVKLLNATISGMYKMARALRSDSYGSEETQQQTPLPAFPLEDSRKDVNLFTLMNGERKTGSEG